MVIKPIIIEVANDFLKDSKSFFPNLVDIATLNPAVHPKANCNTKNDNGLVSFIPANCWGILWPTIIASLIEYICWNKLDIKIGKANNNIALYGLFFVKSIGPNIF